MMNLEWITGNWTWFLASLSIVGVLLNNKKDKKCFFFLDHNELLLDDSGLSGA